MSLLRSTGIVLVLVFQCLFFPSISFAHPPSGIVVDAQGRVYILYGGVVRIESSGKITTIQEDTGHWLALDSRNSFSKIPPDPYNRVTSDGVTFVFGSGAPLVI